MDILNMYACMSQGKPGFRIISFLPLQGPLKLFIISPFSKELIYSKLRGLPNSSQLGYRAPRCPESSLVLHHLFTTIFTKGSSKRVYYRPPTWPLGIGRIQLKQRLMAMFMTPMIQNTLP